MAHPIGRFVIPKAYRPVGSFLWANGTSGSFIFRISRLLWTSFHRLGIPQKGGRDGESQGTAPAPQGRSARVKAWRQKHSRDTHTVTPQEDGWKVNALAGKWGVFRAEMTRRLIRTGYFERGFVYMITKYGSAARR